MMAKRKASFPGMIGIAGAVFLLDRASKGWCLQHFQVGESRQIVSWFYLTLVKNTGTAFGFFQGNNRILLFLSYTILLLLLYAARGLCERGGVWAYWGVAFILGGAIGNIVDRHLYGQVVDFLDFRIWPVFNIADSAITVGAISTAIGLMKHKERR